MPTSCSSKPMSTKNSVWEGTNETILSGTFSKRIRRSIWSWNSIIFYCKLLDSPDREVSHLLTLQGYFRLPALTWRRGFLQSRNRYGERPRHFPYAKVDCLYGQALGQ